MISVTHLLVIDLQYHLKIKFFGVRNLHESVVTDSLHVNESPKIQDSCQS